MMKQTQSAKGHDNPVFVAGINHLLVTNGAACLNNGRYAASVRTFNVVSKGKESVAAQ